MCKARSSQAQQATVPLDNSPTSSPAHPYSPCPPLNLPSWSYLSLPRVSSDQLGEGWVAEGQPATGSHAVGLVLELLREQLVEVVEDIILDNLAVDGCHAVDGAARDHCQVSHVHLPARQQQQQEDTHAQDDGSAYAVTSKTAPVNKPPHHSPSKGLSHDCPPWLPPDLSATVAVS